MRTRVVIMLMRQVQPFVTVESEQPDAAFAMLRIEQLARGNTLYATDQHDPRNLRRGADEQNLGVITPLTGG